MQGWQEKAVEDAHKAKSKLAANKYLFFTNRPHQQITVAQLEDRITRETGLSCAVFEARKISELIHEQGLGGDFLGTTGEKVVTRPPEMPEMCLCAYGNLSADRQNHRDEIYRDTLLIACHEAGQPLTRSEIVDSAMDFLGTTPMHRPLLEKQLQHLVSKGHVRKTSEGTLGLSTAVKKRLSESEHLYLSDWAGLEGAQIQLMKAYGCSSFWSPEDSRQVTVLVCRMFLQQQFELLRHASVDNLVANWSSRLGNPEQQLRDLLQHRGIPVASIRDVIHELAEVAKGRDVISKLTRTVTFVALEGRDPMLSAAALGRRSWDEVRVLVDSSVAIPCLCERLHEPSKTYHFSLSGNAVSLFQELGTSCWMLPGHVEECAAHLIQAYRYEPVESDNDLVKAFRASENAFIAYYGALKDEGSAGNQTLLQFLAAFSRRAAPAAREFSDLRQAARVVMPEIQDLLKHYLISNRFARQAPLDRFQALQKAFDKACYASGKDRQPILREHDVEALAHIASSTENKGESWMMLTWDKTFIQVGHSELPSAFIVSPEMAMDFAQPCRRLSDTQWCALAHRLARITSPSDELTARILDNVARMNPGKFTDASFRAQLLQYRDQALETLPLDTYADYHCWIEDHARAFLKQQQIGHFERTPGALDTASSKSDDGQDRCQRPQAKPEA